MAGRMHGLNALQGMRLLDLAEKMRLSDEESLGPHFEQESYVFNFFRFSRLIRTLRKAN